MASTGTITVDLDLEGFLAYYDEVIERQLPFALSLAINNTALTAVNHLKITLDRYFVIRSKWVRGGIRRTSRATKREPVAVVGSIDDFMAAQALGGIKRPRRGKTIGIPIGVRKRRTDRTTRGKWPGRLLKRKTHTIQALNADGSGGVGVVYRRRKGDTGRAMYRLAKQVKIKGDWPFHELVESTVAQVWERTAAEALEHAIKTAKPPRRRRS